MNRSGHRSIPRVLFASILIIFLGRGCGAAASAQEGGLVVFAAASLKDALDEVNAAYRRDMGRETTTSYAASSTLAKQIEAAAPADIFISADLDWMDYLAKKNLIRAETRANLLGNQLVLIAPSSSTIDSGSRRISRSPRRSATVGSLSPIKGPRSSAPSLTTLTPRSFIRSPAGRVRPIPGIRALSPISGRRQRALSSRSTGSRPARSCGTKSG